MQIILDVKPSYYQQIMGIIKYQESIIDEEEL